MAMGTTNIGHRRRTFVAISLAAMLSLILAGAGITFARQADADSTPGTAVSATSENDAAIFVENWTAEGVFRDRVISGRMFNLPQFGYDLFADGLFGSPSQPGSSIPTPSDYTVGPGDQFVIHITGTVFETHRVTVGDDGRVLLPKAGPVELWGLTFERAQQVIEAEIHEFYVGVQVAVALNQPRSIGVSILGEVAAPGWYNLSGFSTVMHALLEAGGVLHSGTLRDIRIIRAGKTAASIDLYDMVLKGVDAGGLRLRDGDIVFVPTVGSVVAIAGEVRRPAIYELAADETLLDLVTYAGGLVRSADTDRIRIDRFAEGERRTLLEVSLPRDVLEDGATSDQSVGLRLADYDLVYIPPLAVGRLPARGGEVRVHGNVVRPGVYEFREGLTVGAMLERADGLLGDTLLYRGEVYRFLSLDTRQVIAFDVEGALAGDPDHDIPLQEWDEIHVYSSRDIIPEPSVQIAGQVHNPGRYPLTPDMRVRDLIFRAGELTEHAHLGRAELYRASPAFPEALRRVEVLDLAALLQGDATENVLLQDGDRLLIYHGGDLTYTPQVQVSGLVRHAGFYELAAGMHLSDALARAGGVTERARGGHIEIFRIDESGRAQSVAVDVSAAVDAVLQAERGAAVTALNHDPPLQEGDRIVVRGRNEQVEERTVVLSGAVRYPGAYPFAPGDRLADVIERAGGFTADAYEYGIVFTRASLRAQQSSLVADLLRSEWEYIEGERARLEEMPLTSDERERRWRALEHRANLIRTLEGRTPAGRIILDVEDALAGTSAAGLRLQDGDEVFVPEYPETVIVTGAVYMPEAVLYVPDREPNYYVQIVGGPMPGAAAEHMYVVKANGRVETAGTGFTAVRQGDAIVVPFRTDEGGAQ